MMLTHNGASEASASSGFCQCQVLESDPNNSDINNVLLLSVTMVTSNPMYNARSIKHVGITKSNNAKSCTINRGARGEHVHH